MRRRNFIARLGGAAAWCSWPRAQQGDRVRRTGVLHVYDENDPEGQRRVSAFTQALADSVGPWPQCCGWTFVGPAVTTIGDQRSQELVGLHPGIKHDPLLSSGRWGRSRSSLRT